MAQGPHFVTIRKPGKPVRHYVYAWRGGPLVRKQEGGVRPKLTGDLIDEISAARQTAGISGQGAGTFAALIVAYRASPEWNGLAATTQNSWRTWLDRIEKKFGKARLNIFNSRKIRGDILIWRDQWGSQPRSADLAIQVLSRVLSFGVDRGLLEKNQTSGIKQLYDTNRSEIIWTPEDLAAFHQHASVEVSEAVDLAACTGLRRGDLVEVPWSAVGEHAIIWQTNKSRGRARIVVPLLPETREVLARIKARHAAEMEAVRPSRRKPLPETILSNSWWRPWTAMGFGSRFRDGRDAAKLTVHLHDLRGTFATRCMIAGLTDQEIADILGWNTKDVAMIRVRYVDQARVVVAMAERITAGTK
jgi:integrase